MNVQRLGGALVASLALAAVFASSAFATASTSESAWYISGSPLPSGSTHAVDCSAAANFVLKATVAGAETEIEATTLECPAADVIKQEGEHAIATGTLKFSGLTVKKPEGCKTNASITTKAVIAKIYMEGTTAYTRFEPNNAENIFANVPLKECAASGTYPIKGTVFGKSPNETDVEKVDQKLVFSESIQTTAGGSLTMGENAAYIVGEANNEIGGSITFTAGSTHGSGAEDSTSELAVAAGEEKVVEIKNPNKALFRIELGDFSITGAELEYTKTGCLETITLLLPTDSCTISVKNNGATTGSGTLKVNWIGDWVGSPNKGTLEIKIK